MRELYDPIFSLLLSTHFSAYVWCVYEVIFAISWNWTLLSRIHIFPIELTATLLESNHLSDSSEEWAANKVLSLESLDLTQIDILHANIWALFVQVNSLPVILTPQLTLYCLPMIEKPLGIRIKLQHSSQLTFNWPHSISDFLDSYRFLSRAWSNVFKDLKIRICNKSSLIFHGGYCVKKSSFFAAAICASDFI